MNFQELLDSSAFLKYPKLASDVFTAMNVPHGNPVGIVNLDQDYDENKGLLAKISRLFKSIIHKLSLNFSASYSTRFEEVKANILQRDSIHLNYFEKSNAFLNVPEISDLVFGVMNQPNRQILLSDAPIANEKTLYNRIAFVFSSLRHNINLKIFSGYSNNFRTAARNISTAVRTTKQERIRVETERRELELEKIRKEIRKDEKIAAEQKKNEDKKNSLIETLNSYCKDFQKAQESINELESNLTELEKNKKNFETQTSSYHESIVSKNLQCEEIKSQITATNDQILVVDEKIQQTNKSIENHEKLILKQKKIIKELEEEEEGVVYKGKLELARLFKTPLERDLSAELLLFRKELKSHEIELEAFQKTKDSTIEELRTLQNMISNEKSPEDGDESNLHKKLKTIHKEIKAIKEKIEGKLSKTEDCIIRISQKLENKNAKAASFKNAIKKSIDFNKFIYDKLLKDSDGRLDPILLTLFDEEKSHSENKELTDELSGDETSALELNTKEKEVDPNEVDVEIVILEKIIPEEKLIENAVQIENAKENILISNPETNKSLELPQEPLVQPKAEPIRLKQMEVTDILQQYNKDLSALLESFLSRFPDEDILEVNLKNNEFVIKVKKPMKLWVPQKDKEDPKGGSILLFGMENEVQGRLSDKGFEFITGFEVYSKNATWGLVTANIYKIFENNSGQFLIEAGKEIPIIGRKTEVRPMDLAATIQVWASSTESEVVEDDHVKFLTKKLA